MVIKTDIYLETFEQDIIIMKTTKQKDCNRTYRSELCMNDFFSQNQIIITNKLKQIKMYHHFFNTFVDNNTIKLGQLNEKNIEKMDHFNDNHILFIYNDKHKINFRDFITSFKTPKEFLSHLFYSYDELIRILCILKKNNMCVFNITPESILFDEMLKPQLSNFKKTFEINNNNEILYNSIEKLIENEDFVYKPIELHLLFYIFNNEQLVINDKIIEYITNNFIEQTQIIKMLPLFIQMEYREKITKFLNNYKDISKNQIISNVLKYTETWDIFSISLIYLYVIIKFVAKFSLHVPFIEEFIGILIKNIDVDPNRRQNSYKTYSDYNKLFDLQNNWDFVHDLSSDKLFEFYKEL